MTGHSPKLINSPNPRIDYRLYPKIKYPSNREILLPNIATLDISFLEILENRQSKRNFSSRLDLKQISSLLWHTLKIKRIETDKDGLIVWNHSNVPSAGGLATIDTFILNILGEEGKIFFYNRYRHSLNELEVEDKYIHTILNLSQKVIDSTNATQFIFGAQTKNLFSKYEDAESLLWRDAGAIYMAMGFMAEALCLNSCSLGITYEPALAKGLGCEGSLLGVGGVLIGNMLKTHHGI